MPASTASDAEGDSIIYEQDVAKKTPKSNDKRIYEGAIIYSGKFKIITSPLSLDEAVTWAYTMSNIPVHMGGMGRNTKWGIYTYKIEDAYTIYPFFLPINANSPQPAPIIDENIPGVYPHIHLPNRLFNDKHNHFHIWFGEIGGHK